MSLTQGLASPRTPLRRFLDRELSAGVRRLRASYLAQLPTMPLILPGPGVGYEAGTVGTAIDQRLRFAFTQVAGIDAATVMGVDNLRATTLAVSEHAAWEMMERVGHQLLERLHATIFELQLDDRGRPLARTDEEEEHLARLLLGAAWYTLNFRNPAAFPLTPLCKAAFADPGAFTLTTLLALPHHDLVSDTVAQVRAAGRGPLGQLRHGTVPEMCLPGPTFDGSAYVAADADLIVDGLLIDFKSTRRTERFPLPMILQLLGYTLMDFTDRYRIDRVGVCLTRAGALIHWPIEDYLALLGARRRDLTELRAAFHQLLTYTGCRADDDPLPEEPPGVEQLLADLSPPIGPRRVSPK
ncbi:hypothetical protein [Nonomuraea jabiensis]|uniref:Uncharacterized protein n=1 Tax=Nonomuraea jabiensis TaxID=882448 RepID=A0A7W9FYU6_9ACTN|nr:hypothetical protein [Nonomuraea jabiensis]MBB5774045.1 hypothetical protein [Nonomuraea jabiensis]